MVEIQGFCDERFLSVKEAFERNFKERLEVGASFAATLNGKFIIDLWSGYADAAQALPWEENTIVNVYSTTKIMTAICTPMLVDRGLLDLDSPVAKYWPEFAQNGKKKIPVRFLLSHSSGLSGWEEKITIEDLYDWDKVVNLLATQKPWWEPGTSSGYHSSTFGNLLGELVLRITGKTIGTFFKEEVAEPLKADFHIGLPKEHDYRVGELIPPPPADMNLNGEFDPNSVALKTFMNPLMNPEETKTRAWRAAELPADNGHGNARSVARITSAVACGGDVDEVHLLSIDIIERALEEQSYGKDLVLMIPIRFGLGFGLQNKERPIGPNQRILYWGGWGGSVSIMDLDAKLSIAYVMNKMVTTSIGDPRSTRLIEALYNSI
ncbi:MAG: serine hydrolase domain-containing protein [Promethearchaeota archaeon]|jgi:CubicO group peptidase (beta-lactamase class C family)